MGERYTMSADCRYNVFTMSAKSLYFASRRAEKLRLGQILLPNKAICSEMGMHLLTEIERKALPVAICYGLKQIYICWKL